MVRSGRQALRVLTYHRVANPEESPHLDPRLVSAVPAEFERQMRRLARTYSVVSMESVLDVVNGRSTLPGRAVLITFDDAYLDFLDHAWPILSGLRLPVTVFVPTGFPDHPERSFRSDRLHRAFFGTRRREPLESPIGLLPLDTADDRRRGLRRLQNHLTSMRHADAVAWVERICAALDPTPATSATVMSWEQLRKLAAAGVSLCGHSQNHADLTRLSPDEVRREVTRCQADLHREIGSALPVFCYPRGGHDATVVTVLREAGIRLAFTTLDGHNDLSRTDLLRLRRTNITRRTTGLLFRMRLTKWGALADAWRHRRSHETPTHEPS